MPTTKRDLWPRTNPSDALEVMRPFVLDISRRRDRGEDRYKTLATRDKNPGFIPDYSNSVRDTESVCMPVSGRHALNAAALDEGKLFARRFDGEQWQAEPILVSQPDTIHNWFPNVNQDVRSGICVLYSRSIDQANLGIPLAVMVSVLHL